MVTVYGESSTDYMDFYLVYFDNYHVLGDREQRYKDIWVVKNVCYLYVNFFLKITLE